MIDVTPGPQQQLSHSGSSVKLGSVEEGCLHEEVIIVEWKVESKQPVHHSFLLVSCCKVENVLFVDVLMFYIASAFDQPLQCSQA